MMNAAFPNVSPYVLAALVLHAAFFAALIVPFWRVCGKARIGGGWSLLLVVPAVGLLAIPVLLATVILRRAGWSLAWFAVTLVPLANVVFLWIFAYADWSRTRRRSMPVYETVPESGDVTVVPEAAAPLPEITRSGPAAEAQGEAAGENGDEVFELDREASVNRRRTEPLDDMTRVTGAPEAVEEVEPATIPRRQSDGRVWLLSAEDRAENDLRIRVTEADLRDAEGGLLIGRSRRCDFVLVDDSVSRNHARLSLRNGELMVEDLDSMNGTFVGGVRLEPGVPHPVPSDSDVDFGQMKMTLRDG